MFFFYIFFFFNDTATTEIYTLSLHDALPISHHRLQIEERRHVRQRVGGSDVRLLPRVQDRKSTRLNSSHSSISYAVFCLKKKKLPTFLPSTNAPTPTSYYFTWLTLPTQSYSC